MTKTSYRAWDIRKKQMVVPALTLSSTGQLVTVDEAHFNDPFSFFDGCIWMQSIGLTDYKGTEIYEDDWCQAAYEAGNSGRTRTIDGQVVMHNFRWCLKSEDDKHHPLPALSIDVLGNVHSMVSRGK